MLAIFLRDVRTARALFDRPRAGNSPRPRQTGSRSTGRSSFLSSSRNQRLIGTPKPIFERALIGGGNKSTKARLSTTLERPVGSWILRSSGIAAAQLEATRVVQKWPTAFKAMCHAGDVDLDQEVARQIGHDVGNHGPRNTVAAAGGRERCRQRQAGSASDGSGMIDRRLRGK